MMTIGTGIGTGIIIDGRVLYAEPFIDDYNAGSFLTGTSGDWENRKKPNLLPVNDWVPDTHTVQILFNPEGKGFDNNL